MGRLFWKFLLAFWLAVLVAGVGVGSLVWLNHPPHDSRRPTAENCPAPPVVNSPDHIRALPSDRPPPPPKPVVWLVLLGLVTSLLLSGILAWYFSKPIRQLRAALLAVTQGNLDTQINSKMGNRSDELAELGRYFDTMAQTIKALVKNQRQLLHDVSHELRSPLARIQAAIGVAQQQPQKLPQMLSRIERDSTRINDLVGELLFLARFDSNMVNTDSVEVDLTTLIGEVVENARFESQKKGIQIEYQPRLKAIVKGDPELIYRACENVIRNATKHCGNRVMVSLERSTESQQEWIRILVEDDGPGIPEGDLQKIFEPFFRGPAEDRNDSVGLGLTIANRAVQYHGGTITAKNRQPSGLMLALTFPQ